MQSELADLRRKLAMAGGGSAEQEKPKEINGIPFVYQVLHGVPGRDLPALIDDHKARLGSGAILLIAEDGGKAAVAAGVTADAVAKVSAVDLVKAAVEALGGKGGGGRPDLAQGGAKDATRAKEAIAAAVKVLGG
jgi:alanyl-tRNA synthetase